MDQLFSAHAEIADFSLQAATDARFAMDRPIHQDFQEEKLKWYTTPIKTNEKPAQQVLQAL